MKKFASTIFQVFLVFILSLGLLFAFGAVPEEIRDFWRSPFSKASASEDGLDVGAAIPVSDDARILSETPGEILFAEGPKPERLIIRKIGVDSAVFSPETRDISVLDTALKKGVVNYPSGASLNEGNIFLFGHSTNWATVQNPVYKSLNGLEGMALGDEVLIRSGNREYVYKVFSINLTGAEKSLVNLENDRRVVTISTCDTFGKKTDRIVVEALYERDYGI